MEHIPIPTNDVPCNEETTKQKNDKKDFSVIMNEFLNSLLEVFPEVSHQIFTAREINPDEMKEYCKRVYPERFFDIIYQNEDIFTNAEINTKFIPNIDFKNLWGFSGVSETTKTTIWKYLQLITLSVVSDIDSDVNFGDTAKLFEAINSDSFKEKLGETLNNIQSAFIDENGEPTLSETDIPNRDDIHDHLQKMLNGKIGQLANEIAEETAKELDVDMSNPESMTDIFSKVIKNPTKLMGLVKSIGTKLEAKIKSGELKESELMEEASEMMKNMKNMPGMGDIGKMMSSMGMPGMPGMGGKTKVNMGAMQSKLDENIKQAKTRERLVEKIDTRKREKTLQEEVNRLKAELMATDSKRMEDMLKMYGDEPEDSNGIPNVNSSGEKKKKKKKKKNQIIK
jgi:hypothetical protein